MFVVSPPELKVKPEWREDQEVAEKLDEDTIRKAS